MSNVKRFHWLVSLDTTGRSHAVDGSRQMADADLLHM
jgi:hypothetical protein